MALRLLINQLPNQCVESTNTPKSRFNLIAKRFIARTFSGLAKKNQSVRSLL